MDGVVLQSISRHWDDRGWLAELSKQSSFQGHIFGQNVLTLAYPGVIKAFHYHLLQTDYWTFVQGNAQVVLHDLREGSVTKGETDVYYMGAEELQILKIPPGVAHGYRVLGYTPAVLLYTVSREYNPYDPDEYRIPYNDPSIAFDWDTRMR